MKIGLVAVLAFLAASTGARAESGWTVSGVPGGPDFAIASPAGGAAHYRFECGAYAMTVTSIGVSPVPKPTASNPAKLALVTDKANSALWPAVSRPSPGGGWDLSITLPKRSKAVRTLGQATTVSLVTYGYNQALTLNGEDRAVLGDFVARCLKA